MRLRVLAVLFGIVLQFPIQSHAKEAEQFSNNAESPVTFWIKLAEQGNPVAQFNLGSYYQYGSRGLANLVRATASSSPVVRATSSSITANPQKPRHAH